jgi:hypothetical protein
LLVIDDPELQGKDEWRRFATLQQERACLVALDLSRLSHESWRQLPAAMWCDQQGKTHVLWNYHHELADWQIREMSLRPYLIHQYAKHVANQWEAQTSRRPRIHVTSLVSKNFRYPSLMIDPRVDLARAPTRMFRHNEWIMQLETETERQVTPNRGGADAPPGEVAGYNSASDSGLRITARFPNGIKKQGIQGHPGRGNYTVTKWHPNGLIAFRAEYRDDQPHGQQSKWHPNGTVALQIEYRHGRRHGKATAWNEQGQKKQEGEFHDGQLVGSWTVWSADGVADKPSPEGPGARR